ncbi:MAG: DUF4380 domain-containing protein [Armatimonadota bacterium]
MHRLIALAFAALLALALTCAAAAEARSPRVERVDYHGWSGAYRLTNGTVELVFVPQVGRILRYGFLGGPNVLWEKEALRGKTVSPTEGGDWVNFGGDKLWPAPQSRWGWPPDPHLDRGEHQVEVLPGGRVQVTGPISPKGEIRFSRIIALAPSGTGVTLTNRLHNAGSREVEWSVWEVAQVDAPDRAGLPLYQRGRFPQGYRVFETSPPVPGNVTTRGDAVWLTRDPQKGGKIGGDSPQGRVWAELKGLRFEISASHERGASYPDEGCSLEIWSNPDPDRYMELEVLSPLRKIPPGKSAAYVTRWKLSRLNESQK